MGEPMLAALMRGGDREALRFSDRENPQPGDRVLSYGELAAATWGLAGRIGGQRRVAVWATPTIETCVGVVAALLAGVPVVPINPKIGERELDHILSDSEPGLLLAAPDVALPELHLPIVYDAPSIVYDRQAAELGLAEVGADDPAMIVYTSGTTGPPKGVVLPRRAIISNLDALASAWEWTSEDVVVHALPLFHVHGLIIGVLGPLLRGGSVHHIGRFSSSAAAEALAGSATMMFGVPTMYHRLADDCSRDPALAKAVGRARLLVSGSAPLPASTHERLRRVTGQQVVERYGLTESLMNCSVRAGGERRPGTVGRPLDGISLRLVDDGGAELADWDGETVGEIEVRGPNLFLGYLNRQEATAEVLRDGWFRTGDMAVRDPDGYVRIVGRRATDLIKSGGYKIGAGEIENALLEHPAVAEAAVTGAPDDDLGERVVAWVVPAGEAPSAEELADHVARLLAPHKRPRVVHFLDALPRNEMGKIMKRALHG
jgi:malonyl-CoA/methylmalonyl-CoA synthetase